MRQVSTLVLYVTISFLDCVKILMIIRRFLSSVLTSLVKLATTASLYHLRSKGFGVCAMACLFSQDRNAKQRILQGPSLKASKSSQPIHVDKGDCCVPGPPQMQQTVPTILRWPSCRNQCSTSVCYAACYARPARANGLKRMSTVTADR